ncbi:MAG: LapA family protein [Rhodobacteraceae bacterium]|nr:LapA family protein [Paracoccaceae bacterium]
MPAVLRAFRYVFLGLLGLVLVTVAFANRAPVTVQLLPDDLAVLLGFQRVASLPLFLVILAGIVAGLLIGFVWEWLRESRHRSAADQRRREVARLEREVGRLREAADEPKDEILALLEKGTGTR